MNINKDVIYYSASGGKLSYVDTNNGTNEDEERFDHTDSTENSYNAYNNYTKISYIKASDSIKAKCGNEEITILDNNGVTNLKNLYVSGNGNLIPNIDALISIFANNLTEEKAKEICIGVGNLLDIKSNYS